MAKDYERMDEPTLIRQCLRKNSKAQKEFYERYSTRMLGVCYRYAGNRTDAEDILQEGFVKVFTNLGQFRSDGPVEAWMRRIMVNTSLNFLQRNKLMRQTLEIDDSFKIASSQSSDHTLEKKDLMALIQTLPTGYRTIINMYAIEGYSHKEIGDMLGIAESSSRSQYTRARALLAQLLGENRSDIVNKYAE